MKKIFIFTILIIFPIFIWGQENNYNSSEHIDGHSKKFNKIIISGKNRYYQNLSIDKLVFVKKTENKLKLYEVKDLMLRNSIGEPFNIHKNTFFKIAYYESNVDIVRENLIDTIKNKINSVKLNSSAIVDNIVTDIPVYSFLYYNFFYSYRNSINFLEIDNKEHQQSLLFENLFKIDFIIYNDTTIDFFIRDNIRFTRWRSYVAVNGNSTYNNNSKPTEIGTYTFLLKNNKALAHIKDNFYSPKKYSYNAFDTIGIKRLSNYGFKMAFLEYIPQIKRDSILNKYYQKHNKIDPSLYTSTPLNDIQNQLSDSLFTSLYARLHPCLYNSKSLNVELYDKILKKLSNNEKEIFDKSLKKYAEPNFFLGNFKVIMQNENYFIINEHYRDIYYLSKEKVIKIGQVKYIQNEKELNNEKCFIEDRDNNQLIFFAPVEWYRKDYPLPNVRIITGESEFDKLFELLENENN